MDVLVVSLLNGIAFGTILFILTTGLSLTIGVMGILNLTHGALFMIGAFVGWTVAVEFGMSYWLGLLFGSIVAGLVGLFIERTTLRFLHKQINEQVILTIGFIYIIANISLWMWGGLVRAPFTDPILSGSLSIMGWGYPVYRIALIGIGLIVVSGLVWLLEKTKIGTVVRAGMDNKEMTSGLGINLGRINYLVFFLGAFLAGFAGVIGAQMMTISVDMGWSILLLALIVLVIGGIGSIYGAFAAAILIGMVDAFGRLVFPDFAMFLMYSVMVIVLIAKPTGLMARGA